MVLAKADMLKTNNDYIIHGNARARDHCTSDISGDTDINRHVAHVNPCAASARDRRARFESHFFSFLFLFFFSPPPVFFLHVFFNGVHEDS